MSIPDKPKPIDQSPPTEVEVTEEMINAGMEVIIKYGLDDDSELLLRDAFRAMQGVAFSKEKQ